MKKIKFYILLVAFALISFIFAGTNVNAAEIHSAKDLIAFFDGKDVTITGNTVKLNSDVTIDDLIEFMDGEYTFDLNGKTLKLPEIYILGGKLTINGATKEGKLDSRWVSIEEKNSTLIVNKCIFATDDVDTWFDGEKDVVDEIKTVVDNFGGTVVFKDSTIEDSIWNTEGHMTLENVTVPMICQQGDAIIKGGKYESFSTDISYCKTTIYGGEFVNKGEETTAFIINDNKPLDPLTINTLLAEGYVATFDEYDWDYYEYEGTENYTGFWNDTVKIIKEEELSKVYSDAFKRFTTNGIWEVPSLKPAREEDSEFLLSSIAQDIMETTGYQATAYAYMDALFDENYKVIKSVYNPDVALISLVKDGEVEERYVKLKYLEPSEQKAKTVNSVLDKMKYWENNDDMEVDNAYMLDDLYLINYLFANTGKTKVNGAQALNFSKDLINATGGANISFKYDSRAGSGNPNALYSYSMGQVIVYYNSEAFTSRNAALTANHVLYIPDNTKDTDDAYIATALKRVKEYIGEKAVKDANFEITIGGKLSALTDEYETYNEYNLFDETKTGNNYYVVKLNGKSYNFVICKKEASKLETPKYVGMNLGNNITITTNSTSVPLDTAISVKSVKDNSIKKALGTDAYAAYDITLYSAAKDAKITKLDDGKFDVTIPVPKSLESIKDENLTVYYIDDNGKKVEHTAIVKDDFISFKTNHFSTYVVAERIDEVINPNTSDNITLAVATLVISMVGIVVGIKFIKK